MAEIIVKRGEAGDEDHLENLAEYVSDKRALIIGGNGVDYHDLNAVKEQMILVKQYFGKEKNCSLVQMILSYNKSVDNAEDACNYTRQTAEFFNEDYQTMYCVHAKDNECSNYHAHLIINPVNINDGKMMQLDLQSMEPFREHFAEVTGSKNRVIYKKP